MAKRAPTSRNDSQLSGIVGGVVVVAMLYFAKVVFIPLTLALLLSFLLTPVVAILERIKLPRGMAIFLVLFSLGVVIGTLGWKTSQEFVDLTSQIPAYKSALLDKVKMLKGPNSQSLAKVSQTVKDLENEISTSSGDAPAAPRYKPAEAAGNSESHPLAVAVVPPANPLEALQSMLGPIATGRVARVSNDSELAGALPFVDGRAGPLK